MIPAANYETFADAILKKLINEIAAQEPLSDQASVKETPQTRPSLRGGFARAIRSITPMATTPISATP
jgi:hypothetical protein